MELLQCGAEPKLTAWAERQGVPARAQGLLSRKGVSLLYPSLYSGYLGSGCINRLLHGCWLFPSSKLSPGAEQSPLACHSIDVIMSSFLNKNCRHTGVRSQFSTGVRRANMRSGWLQVAALSWAGVSFRCHGVMDSSLLPPQQFQSKVKWEFD